MLKFEHLFEEHLPMSDLSLNLYETPADAKVEFSVENDGIWLAANAEGFLYLARIFAELGSRELEKGYHFHRPDWLRKEASSDKEVSVELLHG